MVLSVTVQSLFGPAAAGGGGGGGGLPSADPLPRSTNCLLMSSTGCCAAHHRWLKFNSNPPLCKLLNFKCRPFDYVVSSAPNKNGRHPQIDSCQRELLLSAVSKLGTKATDAGSPAAHLPKNFSRFDLRRRGGFPLQASLSLCHYFLPFIKPRFHIAL